MDINTLTIGEARQISAALGNQQATQTQAPHPYQVGKPIFVRTVTYHFFGLLKAVHDRELVIEKGGSWVADSGRFADAMKTGIFAEEEPLPCDWIIGRDTIVDAGHIEATAFPRSQK